MARRVLAWECEFCGEIKKSELICKRHEKACLGNPEAKNCVLCVHSVRGEYLTCRIKGCRCSRAISANCDKFSRGV